MDKTHSGVNSSATADTNNDNDSKENTFDINKSTSIDNNLNDYNAVNSVNSTPRRKSINYPSSPRKQQISNINNFNSTISHASNGIDVDNCRRNDSGKTFRRTQSSTFISPVNNSPSVNSKFKRTNSTSDVITKTNTTTRIHNRHNQISIYVRVRGFLPT